MPSTYFSSWGDSPTQISSALQAVNSYQFLQEARAKILSDNNLFRNNPTLQKEFEKALSKHFSHQAQAMLVENSFLSYQKIIDKGYTYDEATLLLQTTRIAHWSSFARRLPSASEIQQIDTKASVDLLLTSQTTKHLPDKSQKTNTEKSPTKRFFDWLTGKTAGIVANPEALDMIDSLSPDRLMFATREKIEGWLRQIEDRPEPATSVSIPTDPQTSPARPLTNEEIALLDKAKTDPNQPALTRELLNIAEYQPTEIIQVGEQKYFMVTRIIKSQSKDDKDVALAFVVHNNQLVPRIFWKSDSSAGWRATNGTILRVIFKGKYHYTQESKPVQAILDYLNNRKIDTHITSDRDFMNSYFNLADNPTEQINWSNEITQYPDHGSIAQFQQFMPGKYGDITVTAEDFDNFTYPDGFVPDFNSEPISTTRTTHDLLGEITLDTYETTWNGRPLRWVMAFDNNGRVWIDRIYFADSAITSYGVYGEVINSGALTNKPLEYRKQITQLSPDLSLPFPQDPSYADVTPLLDHLAPIKQYREARWSKFNIPDHRGSIEKVTTGEYQLIVKRDKLGNILEIIDQSEASFLPNTVTLSTSQAIDNTTQGSGTLYGEYSLSSDGTLIFSIGGQIQFKIPTQTPNSSSLPIGIQVYAKVNGINPTNIVVLKTTIGSNGDKFYRISVNNTYEIGIDENGVAWGGGVQLRNNATENIALTKLHPTKRDKSGKVIKRAHTNLTPIGRSIANKLHNANISSVTQLLTQPPQAIAQLLGVTELEATSYQQALTDIKAQRLIQQSISAKQRFILQQQNITNQFGSLTDFASHQQVQPLAQLFATLYKNKYGSVTNLFRAYTLRQQLLPFTAWYANLDSDMKLPRPYGRGF